MWTEVNIRTQIHFQRLHYWMAYKLPPFYSWYRVERQKKPMKNKKKSKFGLPNDALALYQQFVAEVLKCMGQRICWQLGIQSQQTVYRILEKESEAFLLIIA